MNVASVVTLIFDVARRLWSRFALILLYRSAL